jgi:hypothetical protein
MTGLTSHQVDWLVVDVCTPPEAVLSSANDARSVHELMTHASRKFPVAVP